MLIENVAGESYAEHLRRTQFEPLGLAQTIYCAESPIIPYRAEGYALEDGVLVNAAPLSMNPPGAAGALCSTPRDLVRWTEALTTGRVVSTRSYEVMTTPTTLTEGRVQQYGYGLGRARLAEHEVIQHSGGINGFSAFMAYYPASDLTVVVLANGPTNTGALSAAIAGAVLGLAPPPPAAPAEAPAPVPIDAAALARYVGTYDLAPAVPLHIEVRVEGGVLVGQATGQGSIPLTHIGDHTFVGPQSTGIRMVFTLEDGRATQFMLHQGGRSTVARRLP
jgi:CubicO group peptidase (beta-lactamase class C family)